jgi:deazaflavin-dependent oxidoreductase (nitroreductase family)
VLVYPLGLGGIFGSRLVHLVHTGRRSGRPRHVVLEVLGRHAASGGFLVPAGYGTRSQWLRNVLHDPRVRFQVGGRRYRGVAEPLPAAESGAVLSAYARRHPRAAAALMRFVGQITDGSDADYRRIGSDLDHGVPVVLLRSAPGPDPAATAGACGSPS